MYYYIITVSFQEGIKSNFIPLLLITLFISSTIDATFSLINLLV